MKIGIVTFEFNYNYGAILQATALKTFLENRGHIVKIINRGWGMFSNLGGGNRLSFNSIISKIVGRFYSNKNIEKFKAKYWSFSRPIISEKDYSKVYSEFDVIIVGSDQIWNSACICEMGLHYFGINVDTSWQRLIAYAPSFGKNRFETSDENLELLKRHLKNFHAISVREKDGITLLSHIFNIQDVTLVLDPTMLMDKEFYLRLAGGCKLGRRRTLAYYFLDDTPEKQRFIFKIAKKLDLTPVNTYLPHNNGIPILGKLKSLKYPAVEKWIKNIAESQMVITDSFHGTVFSILFNRDFYTLRNDNRGKSRFDSILSTFNLENRLLDSCEKLDTETIHHIDYSKVNSQLKILREYSQSFLIKSLL